MAHAFRKFALYGTFDVSNYGDCTFPHLWTSLLKEEFGSVDIELYSPTSSASKILGNLKVRAIPPSYFDGDKPDVPDADVHILIGGETLGAGHSEGTYVFPRDTPSAFVRLWCGPIAAAQKARHFGNRVSTSALYAVGLTSGRESYLPLIAQCLGFADHVYPRDAVSIARLGAHGSINASIAQTDPMFLISELKTGEGWRREALQALGPVAERPYVVLHASVSYFSEKNLHLFLAEIERFAADKTVVLLPVCHFLNDVALLREIKNWLSDRGVRIHLASGERPVLSTAAIIGNAEAVISTSLHAAVTGVAFGIPVAVICHGPASKHYGVLANIGLADAAVSTPQELGKRLSRLSSEEALTARERSRAMARNDLNEFFRRLRAPMADNANRYDLWRSALRSLLKLEYGSVASGDGEPLRRRLHLLTASFPSLRRSYHRARFASKARKLTDRK